MDRALVALQREFASGRKADAVRDARNRGSWVTRLRPRKRAAAGRLDLTEGAVKVTIHRLRKRFRDVVRLEIAQTLRDPLLVDEELRHLIEALT